MALGFLPSGQTWGCGGMGAWLILNQTPQLSPVRRGRDSQPQDLPGQALGRSVDQVWSGQPWADISQKPQAWI